MTGPATHNLTVRALTAAAAPIPGARAVIELIDAGTGEPTMAGGDGAMVMQSAEAVTGADGAAVFALIANSALSPSTLYRLALQVPGGFLHQQEFEMPPEDTAISRILRG